MLKDSSPFHSSFLPVAVVTVTIIPHHFALLVVGAILEGPLVLELTLNDELSTPLLATSIPVPLHLLISTS